jgi:putative SOS response-associated peptidase YedK
MSASTARRDAAVPHMVRSRGLIPYWAKDIKIGFSTINARAEEVDTKPAFREAFRQRRCLVPLNSFYEWKKSAPASSLTPLP